MKTRKIKRDVFDESRGPIDERYFERLLPVVDKSKMKIIEPPTLETDHNPFYDMWIEEFDGVPHNYRPT